nr:sulfotransferase [uncultured Carboxylicivirga sp.]
MTKHSYSFLMCTERGGSNFIVKLLNKHSLISGPATKHIINPLARNYFRYLPFEKNNNWETLLNDTLNLFNIDFSKWHSEYTLDELKQNIPVGEVDQLIKYFFEKEARSFNKTYSFIKEITTYEFFPYLEKHFHSAKYVYLVRDPRDMALSWKKSKIHEGGVYKAALRWKNDQQQFLKNHYLLIESNRSLLVKYELLTQNTKKELIKITKFLNIGFEEDMLVHKESELTNMNAQKQECWSNLSKDVITNNSNKFLNELSDFEIKIIEKICYFEMLLLGYSPVNSWEELENISQTELLEFANNESKTIHREINEGVKLNMEAKKRFYQKNNG